MDMNKSRDQLDAFGEVLLEFGKRIKGFLHDFINALDDWIHRNDSPAEDFERYVKRSMRHSDVANRHAQEARNVLRRVGY